MKGSPTASAMLARVRMLGLLVLSGPPALLASTRSSSSASFSSALHSVVSTQRALREGALGTQAAKTHLSFYTGLLCAQAQASAMAAASWPATTYTVGSPGLELLPGAVNQPAGSLGTYKYPARPQTHPPVCGLLKLCACALHLCAISAASLFVACEACPPQTKQA